MLSIRTQDRMALVPYDKRISIYNVISKNDKNENIVKNDYEINCGGYPLGIYKTQERALKVLNEIQKYVKGWKYEQMGTMINRTPVTFNEVIELENIYEMPKE